MNRTPPTSRSADDAGIAPLVSVVTVCRNAEPLIGHTVKSVLDQSCQAIEYIIVDGASADNTLSVIEQVGLGRPIVHSEPDDGIYHAMNKGILRASGTFVLFLNAGDTFLSHRTVETALRAINKAPHADVYHAGVLWLNAETGQTIPKPAIRATKANLFRGSLNHQAMLIRRELFDRIGKHDESFHLAGDYEWLLRAVRKHHCQFERLDAYLSVFLLGGHSTSGENQLLIESECERARAMYYNRWDAARYRPWIRARKILGI